MIKYKINDSVFSVIDNNEKAYWIGFLAADGYVDYKTNRIGLKLKLGDIKHLEKFKTFLNFSGPIVIEKAELGKSIRKKW